MNQLEEKREALLDLLRDFNSCGIAFSGGVDSAVVAVAAQSAIGDRAIAVTGISPSLPTTELEAAERLAATIGIRHEMIETQEFERPEYVRNDADRCFHCKTELYSLMSAMAERFGFTVILNGVNADDLSDYRPGLAAAANFEVRSPLAECGLTKQEVRGLARVWELSVWDKPASPCLSSRVAYGEQVTPERLRMIEQAESWLHSKGFRQVRVRYHRGDVGRIEVPSEQISRLIDLPLRAQLTQALRAVGFKFISVDLEGFRSGSLNQLVQLDTQPTEFGDR